MYVKTYSACLQGIDAVDVEVELDISKGLPAFGIVGLADKSINESRDRVTVALKSSGFSPAPKRILVNLAPAKLRKEGPQMDLAIATSMMLGFDYIKVDPSFLENFCFLGELSLTGEIKHVVGILPLALAASESKKKYLIVSSENSIEANLISLRDDNDTKVFAVKNLIELKKLIEDLYQLERLENELSHESSAEKKKALEKKSLCLTKLISNSESPKLDKEVFFSKKSRSKDDFSEVIGQIHAKRGLEIAAAGNHHCLLIGPPGCGKSMLAERFNTIMPELRFEQALESTKIYSVSNLLKETLITDSPIRAPHHSCTPVTLIGGGVPPKPGEVSLAHHGVLFLDELTEFNRYNIEQLRQIMDNREITLTKSSQCFTYPADFLLITACNPCPCGFLGDSEKSCSCSPTQIHRYISKLSGPLLDRIDIHLQLNRLNKDEMYELSNFTDSLISKHDSKSIKANVTNARKFARTRKSLMKKDSSYKSKVLTMDKETRDFLHEAVTNLKLSARAHGKVVKIARTIADLDSSETIDLKHIAEALQFRSINWEQYACQDSGQNSNESSNSFMSLSS